MRAKEKKKKNGKEIEFGGERARLHLKKRKRERKRKKMRLNEFEFNSAHRSAPIKPPGALFFHHQIPIANSLACCELDACPPLHWAACSLSARARGEV